MAARRSFFSKGFLVRLVGALLFAWLIMVLAVGWMYISRATSITCAVSTDAPEGFTAVSIPLSNGKMLPGWWHPPENGVVLVLLAGHSGGRDAMLPEAEMLAEAGYGVLTTDYSYCLGEQATFGYAETEDVRAALDYAGQQPGVENIGAFGFSAGGVAAIRAAARMPEVEFIIAAGSYANLFDEITAWKVPPLSMRWQFERTSALAYWLQVGIPPWQVSPIDDLPALAPRPVFLIHGADEVERSRGYEQFAVLQAAYSPDLHDRISLWVVPGAGHGEYYTAAGETYFSRLKDFIPYP
jgi:dipeptidyl aminopeptidase/acylaminoacyl peptidase